MKTTKGLVVPAGGGKHLDMGAPGRCAALKLLGHETNESIMVFEETVPAGTKSLFHLHRDSDELAWVLAGEITFQIGDEVSVGGPGTCAFFPRNIPHTWKNSGNDTGRVLFIYTPAAAGGYVEELLHRPGPMKTPNVRSSASATAGKSSVPIRYEGNPHGPGARSVERGPRAGGLGVAPGRAVNDVVLRQAGPEDSAFAFHAQRAAFREYVEKADGWDEGASNSGSTPSGSAPRAIA